MITAVSRRNRVGGIELPDFRPRGKAVGMNTVQHWPRKETHICGAEPRAKLMHIRSIKLLRIIREPRTHSGRRTPSSMNGAGKAGQAHAKEGTCTTISYHEQS